jgi:hypothetical protein
MMPCGSRHVDPVHAENAKIMMLRGSGSADPGIRTVIDIFYDARIRECGSGRQNRYQNFL